MSKTSYEVLFGFLVGLFIALVADRITPAEWDSVSYGAWAIALCSLTGLAWNAFERWDPR